MADKEYSPADIATILGQEHDAGSLAAAVAAFWPTIKAALVSFDKETKSQRVKPIPIGD